MTIVPRGSLCHLVVVWIQETHESRGVILVETPLVNKLDLRNLFEMSLILKTSQNEGHFKQFFKSNSLTNGVSTNIQMGLKRLR